MKTVVKLGGSVLRSEECYKKRAESIIKLTKQQPTTTFYIIVSAQYGHTQQLIEQIGKERSAELDAVLQGKTYCAEFDNHHIARHLVQGEFDSTDKLHSMLPNAKKIKQEGQFPIVANSSYLNGIIHWKESMERKHLFDTPNQIYLIPGFAAVDEQGNTVLLGRNASDVVAAAIAKICDADLLIYVKDVEGVYEHYNTPHQQIYKELTLKDARTAGKVLDARIVDILEDSRCDVHIGHADNLEKVVEGKSGTRIQRR